MANVTWDVFFPDVLVHAVGAPDPLVRQALCKAAREFFGRSRAWREWLSPITTTEGVGVGYSFTLPATTEVVRLERATVDGLPLNLANYTEFTSDWAEHPDGDQALVSRDLVTFQLNGSFAAGRKVQAQASLIPSRAATGIPDYLANKYMEALAEGAKSILLLVPDTPFYLPADAELARGKFETAISRASIANYTGHTGRMPRARPSWC